MNAEADIYEKLGALLARMDLATKALEAGSRRFRAGEKRVAALEDAMAALAREVQEVARALHGLADLQDGETRRLARIDESLVFFRGGWRGAAAVGALLVGIGGLVGAATDMLRGLAGQP